MTKKPTTWQRIKRATLTATQFGAAIAIAIAAVIIIPLPHAATLQTPPTQNDIQDTKNPGIEKATLSAALVQWGTATPFQGTGALGINLKVTTPSNVVSWKIVAWANETTPPSVRACSLNYVYFDTYDWRFEADGSNNAGHGTFISQPTTIPERLSTSGDQCFARTGETGTWHLHLCIDLSPPRWLYRDANGNTHYDDHDRCIDQDYPVP